MLQVLGRVGRGTLLSASEAVFGRRYGDAARPWPALEAWDDPVVRGVTALAVASVLVPVLVVGLLAVFLLASPFSGSLPAERPSIDSQITRVYDRNGVEITNFRRFDTSLPVARGDIPPVLVDAVVAAEDQRFFSHKGVDSRGIIRAFTADLKGGGYVEGASTITQQYVRMAYVGDERTMGRKLREAVLAGRVEKELSKDEILYRYLSRAYFGSGAYGVGAAADTYFHKSVKDLDLSESAMLAGLLTAPSLHDPRTSPGEAEYQRLRVLDKMGAQHRISSSQLAEARLQRVTIAGNLPLGGGPATIVQPVRTVQTKYPWFSDYVRSYLIARYGDDKVYSGGLRVQTSLDPDLQAKAEAAVAEALKGTSAPLEMALASVDPRTGQVEALVGGRDFAKSQVNLALGKCPARQEPQPGDGPICIGGGGSGRQPGSSFKPFTLAEALEQGMSVDKTYRGPSTYTYPHCSGVGCTVHNAESGGYGSLSLRNATAYSVNTVYAQLIQDVGVKKVAGLANRMGLTMINPDGMQASGEPYGPSLTLGAAEVSPLDMAAAYGVFANRGMQLAATPIVKVTDATGKVLEDTKARTGKRVLSENVADQVNDVLKDVIGHGTGTAADIGRPDGTAGKTGTAENYSNAWFVGYTPQLSTAVWMGYSDSQRPLVDIKGVSRVFGGTIPAKAWHDYMAAALDKVPPAAFTPPFKPAPPPPPVPAAPSVTPPPTAPPVTYEPPVYLPLPTDPVPNPGYGGYTPPIVTPPPAGTTDPGSTPSTEPPIITPPPAATEPPSQAILRGLPR
jgi:penicillin-binding protein 1A